MNDIWFTGDTHFDHGNIIPYCKRPWIRDGDLENGEFWDLDAKDERTNEMNEALIENWNDLVRPGDMVYHVGDFAFSRSHKRVEELIDRLNGQICLILGNHDKGPVKKARGFGWIDKLRRIKVGDQNIILCHYAMRVWKMSHRGSWHLYGHSHGTLPDDPGLLSMDVGVDCWDYKPIPFEMVREAMSKKQFVPVDHHTGPGRRKPIERRNISVPLGDPHENVHSDQG